MPIVCVLYAYTVPIMRHIRAMFAFYSSPVYALDFRFPCNFVFLRHGSSSTCFFSFLFVTFSLRIQMLLSTCYALNLSLPPSLFPFFISFFSPIFSRSSTACCVGTSTCRFCLRTSWTRCSSSSRRSPTTKRASWLGCVPVRRGRVGSFYWFSLSCLPVWSSSLTLSISLCISSFSPPPFPSFRLTSFLSLSLSSASPLINVYFCLPCALFPRFHFLILALPFLCFSALL